MTDGDWVCQFEDVECVGVGYHPHVGGKRWLGNRYPISVEWVSMLLGYLTPQVQANDVKARDNSISINDVGRKGIVPSSALFLLH